MESSRITTSRPCSTRRLAFSITISATCTWREAGSSKVEDTTSPFTERCMSVTSSGRSSIKQHDQVALGVIGGDGVGDVLQQHGLAGARRRHDQRALALADRRHDVDDARREVLLGRILVLHLQPLVRIERREVVEVDLVARLLRLLEIDGVDLEQREVALAVLGRADMAVDGVAGAQAEAADLRGRDVDVVRAGQVVRFRRAQEAEAVGQHLDHAFADDVDLLLRKLLEDAEHQLLLAHGRGVLDLDALRQRRGARLESLVLRSCSFISRMRVVLKRASGERTFSQATPREGYSQVWGEALGRLARCSG